MLSQSLTDNANCAYELIRHKMQKIFLNFPELSSLLTFKLQQHNIEKSVLFINMLQIYSYLVQKMFLNFPESLNYPPY